MKSVGLAMICVALFSGCLPGDGLPEFGQDGLAITETNFNFVTIYNENFLHGCQVVTVGTHATYLGPAKPPVDQDEPMYKVTITTGEHANKVASIPVRHWHPINR